MYVCLQDNHRPVLVCFFKESTVCILFQIKHLSQHPRTSRMCSSFIASVWFLAQTTTSWSSYDLVCFGLVLVINDVTALEIDNLSVSTSRLELDNCPVYEYFSVCSWPVSKLPSFL